MLGIASEVRVHTVGSAVDVPGAEVELTETPPAGDEELQRTWALRWALRRKELKAAREFAEADRIRALLRSAGWELRDGRDGTAEVRRT